MFLKTTGKHRPFFIKVFFAAVINVSRQYYDGNIYYFPNRQNSFHPNIRRLLDILILIDNVIGGKPTTFWQHVS